MLQLRSLGEEGFLHIRDSAGQCSLDCQLDSGVLPAELIQEWEKVTVGGRTFTVTVRPGKPNKAASGFFSNIIREPLAGEEVVLPVSDDVRHWVASPRAAVHFVALLNPPPAPASPGAFDFARSAVTSLAASFRSKRWLIAIFTAPDSSTANRSSAVCCYSSGVRA